MASLPASKRVSIRSIASLFRRNPILFLPVSIILLFMYAIWNVSAVEAARNTPAAKAKAAQEARAAQDAFEVNFAKDMVSARLRDPDSAQFLDVHLVTRAGDKGVCGYVNSRNGFGGMSGYEAFATSGVDVIISNDAYPKDLKRLNRLCYNR